MEIYKYQSRNLSNFTLHSRFRSFTIIKYVKTRIAIDVTLRGISKFVRTDVATPPTAPKIEISAMPIPPQQAPAPAPMIEPISPVRSFFVLALRNLILNMDMLRTTPVNAQIRTIDKKLRISYSAT
ncbi:MAG: hypothetical protein K5777_03545 [Nitrosopumilus sp.]|nr:hypothetical protein [Nitrosopumilus sp.]